MKLTHTPGAPFALNGDAELLHLNIRKDGPDDERILAVDIKLTVAVPADPLLSYFDRELWPLFYDAAGIVRCPFIASVDFVASVPDAVIKFAHGEVQLFHVKLHKFKLAPLDSHRLRLTFQATAHPTEDEIALLSGYVSDAVRVEIKDGSLFAGA